MTGKELDYIQEAVASGKISGNGPFTEKCHEFFVNKYGFKKVLLTTSCTDALEMAAILADIQLGDEVIVPSYTFVSTANAFVLRGAQVVFCDCEESFPNMDVSGLESLVTPKTKAIVVIHYGGVACDMDRIMALAETHNLLVIEDAAQAIESQYKGQPLGGIGHLGAFSFHETKNVISGEGGMLVINDERFVARSEIIWEKGTNRAEFFRGEVEKYNWVDIGSSFLPSEIVAAFLYAQLENIESIQSQRKQIWEQYYRGLQPLEEKGLIHLARIPEYATNNAHLFFIDCRDLEERDNLLKFLKERGILAVFHYLALHKSPFYRKMYLGRSLPQSERFADCLVRLPLYFELETSQVEYIIKCVLDFYEK